MANTGEIIVTRLRMYINGQPTTTTKPNTPGDPNYIQPFVDINSCLQNADPVEADEPVPTPAPPTPAPPTPAPTPTECYYNEASISTTAASNTTDACQTTAFTTRSHSNLVSANFPENGDTVWTDCGNTALGDGIYSVEDENIAFEIAGGNGVITKVSTCGGNTNVPQLPCSGNTAHLHYVSMPKENLSDFCNIGNITITTQVSLPAGITSYTAALNQKVCKNGRLFLPNTGFETTYYVVKQGTPTSSFDPQSGGWSYWGIDADGIVRSVGTYGGCAGGGGGEA